MDEKKDGWLDGLKKQMDGRMDKKIEKNGWLDGQKKIKNRWMVGWIEKIYEKMDG